MKSNQITANIYCDTAEFSPFSLILEINWFLLQISKINGSDYYSVSLDQFRMFLLSL